MPVTDSYLDATSLKLALNRTFTTAKEQPSSMPFLCSNRMS
jgi:hypothetical protein